MSDKTSQLHRFLDLSGGRPASSVCWHPVKVSAASIEQEIERLLDAPRPANGRRAALIVHPEAQAPGLGFAPGVSVTINALKPGEVTQPLRQNASQFEFCLRSAGVVEVGGKTIRTGKWDGMTIPSMRECVHRNEGREPWVWLTYSNAPLLEKLGAYFCYSGDEAGQAFAPNTSSAVRASSGHEYTRHNAPDVAIGSDGARFRGYEFLTDIPVIDNPALHWPWASTAPHLATEPGDDKRGIMLMYNPATERRNGTTHCFFATLSSTPAGAPPRKVGRGHRHSSVAINYHFSGSGHSVVDGQTIEWSAGDLLLSAPSWSEHAHYIDEGGARILTVQDHPLHIAMESLMWQERMDGSILTLGSQAGQTGYVGPRIAGA